MTTDHIQIADDHIKQAVSRALESELFERNVLAYLKNDPKNRVVTLKTGHQITYVDELILYHDDETNEPMGYQDEIVYVAQKQNEDGSTKPHYLGMSWNKLDQKNLFEQIIDNDLHDAFYIGAAEIGMKNLYPKRT